MRNVLEIAIDDGVTAAGEEQRMPSYTVTENFKPVPRGKSIINLKILSSVLVQTADDYILFVCAFQFKEEENACIFIKFFFVS